MGPLYDWFAAQARAGRLPAVFEYAFLVRGWLAALLLAPLLGGLSHLVVARRLAFLSAALGHAALTGLAIGLVLGEPIESPYGSIMGFSLLSALALVYVKRRSTLPPDTLIGVFLSFSLGLGICLLVAVTKRFNVHQMEAVMFGSLLTVTDTDLLILLVATVGVWAVLARRYNDLLLDSVDPSLARAAGVPSARLDYVFVVLLTASIVVSLKIVGALLVEALVIVPAASARNLAGSMRSYLLWSVALAATASIAGLALSSRFVVPSGGAVVLMLSVVFVVTLLAGAVVRRR